VGKFVRSIPVEDASGAQFKLHEYRINRRVFGFMRQVRCFVLDTGEMIEPVDASTFALIGTGETFCLVEDRDAASPEPLLRAARGRG
jgi:hypothetical protein